MLSSALVLAASGLTIAPAALAEAATLTVEQAIAAARSHDPAFLAAGLAASLADQDRLTAGVARLPQVGLAGSYLKSSTFHGGVDFIANNAPDEYQGRLGVEVPLYTGGALEVAVDKAQATLAAAGQDAAAAGRRLALQVVTEYVTVLKADQALVAGQLRLATAETHEREGKALLKHGAIAALDATRNELEVANARFDVERAAGDVKTARARLATTTGLPPTFALAPLPPAALPAGEPEALVALAASRRPEIGAAKARAEAARFDARIAGAARWPQVGLVGAAGWDTDRFFAPDTFGMAGGVNVSMPIFDWGRIAVQERRADLAARMADYDVARLAQELRSEVAEAIANREVALRQAAIAEQGTALAEQAAKMAATGFRIGGVSNLEYQLAQRALSEARLQHARAKLDLALATAKLRWTLGEPLP